MRGLRLALLGCLLLVAGLSNLACGAADAATIVALGASQTYGKGVARNQSYPAQLEAMLRAKGSSVHIVNAGINGNSTQEMLARVDRAVPNGTSAVILGPLFTTIGKRARLIAQTIFEAASLLETFR